jgi:PhnB protein
MAISRRELQKGIIETALKQGGSMARVSTYLNFERDTEAAFDFYKSVFGTEFIGDIDRMGTAPEDPERPLAEEDKNLVMNVQLPILGGHVLMGTDAPTSMGFQLVKGNNVYINLEPDTRAETDILFDALKEDGDVEVELQQMFWGDYFGSLTDKFGVKWMFNCSEQ